MPPLYHDSGAVRCRHDRRRRRTGLRDEQMADSVALALRPAAQLKSEASGAGGWRSVLLLAAAAPVMTGAQQPRLSGSAAPGAAPSL